MLQNFQPKVVHILTPPHTHKEIAILCLKRGCHVFIEKPMCLSIKEAEEIIDVAKKQELLVCVDHLRLFEPEIIKVKKLLDSGEFGQLANISITEVDNYIERKKTGLSPKWMSALPGEIIYDLLPHHLSMLDKFLPELKLNSITYQKNDTEDITDMHCLFSSSRGTGTIHISLITYPLQNNIVFGCTKGLICIDFRNGITILRKKSDLPRTVARVLDNFYISKQLIWGTLNNIFRFLRGKLDTYAAMDNTIRSFYDSISQNKESPIPGEKGLVVIKLMGDIFEKIPKPKKIKIFKINEKSNQLEKEPPFQKVDVLVTGGTGFIGRKLVNRLLAKGYRVRVLTHRDLSKNELTSFSGGYLEFIKGDISNLNDVENVCKGVETVYHLAAATKGNWFYHLDTTVTGTQNVIDASVKSGVKHLVYVSTISVLNATKYPRNDIIDEDFPYEENPKKRGHYSNAKLMAERIARRHMDTSNNMKITIIRPGLVYGPGKDILSLVGRKLSKKLMLIQGNKNNILPLVYVENLVDALILAKESKEKGIYNVIDKENITMKKFINTYKEITGEKFVTIYLGTLIFKMMFGLADRLLSAILGKPTALLYKLKAVSRRVQHSTKRIESNLGWSSKISFEEGFHETLNSLKANYYQKNIR
jgi:nucleoside-diphosphate-sugar epimerase/predicted dehydrogenase